MRRPQLTLFLVTLTLALSSLSNAQPIDRHALVTRHNPVVTTVDPWAPLSVGNGKFAFTADVSGLQTLDDHYHAKGIPIETLARWAWHQNANPEGFKLSDANRAYTAYGKTLGYPTNDKNPAGRWLRENPHDFPLGQLALDFGRALTPDDFKNIQQTLDLWTGTVVSSYSLDGQSVKVTVACDPVSDTLAVRIESPLLTDRRLGVRLAFPRGHDIKIKNNPGFDWSPDGHTTSVVARSDRQLALARSRDETHYQVLVAARAGVELPGRRSARLPRLSGERECLGVHARLRPRLLQPT